MVKNYSVITGNPDQVYSTDKSLLEPDVVIKNDLGDILMYNNSTSRYFWLDRNGGVKWTRTSKIYEAIDSEIKEGREITAILIKEFI